MGQIALTTVTFRQRTREEICRIAAENGIEKLEWGGDVHLPPNDPNAIKEVLTFTARYGIESISYGSYYRLGENDYALFEKIAETATSIGARVIRIWQGNLPSKKVDEALFRNMTEETITLSEIAEKKNLKIAFEFHNGTNNDCGEAAVKFLKAVNRENVGTYWQPQGIEQDAENLKAVLPYLMGVHVFHWNKRGKRYSLKRGEKQWRGFFTIIRDAGIEVPFIMEFVKGNRVGQLKKDVLALREILGEVYGR